MVTDRVVVTIAGVDFEIFERGRGAPVLFFHGAQGFSRTDRFLDLLAQRRTVVAPSHPGFGQSALPDWLDSVNDIAHLYLELTDRLGLPKFDLIGCSLGGWIAADLASKAPERVDRLVMIGPVGVKIGPSDRLDIPDVFALRQDELDRLLFHDADKARLDVGVMSDEQLRIVVRNRETLALLAWEPYMHDPKLRHRLHRVDVPALFLRGASDGLVSAKYLAGYAALLPNAQTATIVAAGHMPHVERPDAVAAMVLEFLDARRHGAQRSGTSS
jgi:pimeloyl-ACP methyl ester carboxylesterase